jgi:hypothetical protein
LIGMRKSARLRTMRLAISRACNGRSLRRLVVFRVPLCAPLLPDVQKRLLVPSRPDLGKCRTRKPPRCNLSICARLRADGRGSVGWIEEMPQSRQLCPSRHSDQETKPALLFPGNRPDSALSPCEDSRTAFILLRKDAIVRETVAQDARSTPQSSASEECPARSPRKVSRGTSRRNRSEA